MINYLIVPGLGNSGPAHWQSYFESGGANFNRVEQKEWDEPDGKDWIANIDEAVLDYDPATVVLIGHSLGCMAIAKWAEQFQRKIKGALLVAPSDLEAPQYTFAVSGFLPVPKEKLCFKSIVVASTNDPWVSIERAREFSDNWGSEFVNLGEAGHINAASGHYQWQVGLDILEKLS